MITSPVVYIRWRDANYQDGEIDIDTLDQHCELDTVGWLIKDTPDAITVSLEHPFQGRTRRPLSIPKINIVEMRAVKFGRVFTRRKVKAALGSGGTPPVAPEPENRPSS